MAKENQERVQDIYKKFLRMRTLINTVALIAFVLVVFWQGWTLTPIVVVAAIITIVISSYMGYKHRCPKCDIHLGRYSKKECPSCHIKLK
ncbi:hypothetical protein [Vallitalea okinawensis]|uniref:hypothetical protein n=1 Tax=Vallitalea okinawensis TaxID=2078660 RepID=UPI000CFDD0A9|nr:hypothetical protein [Vallitalea okinawensis]